jgi:hypothetical protein
VKTSFTLFIRPAGGLIQQDVLAKPSDPIQTGIVNDLLPTRKKRDTVGFYGAGVGFDINASERFAVRATADFVRMDLFQGFLSEGQNAVRLSIGPTFRFGSNVRKRVP